jgi:hypothetical protein
MPANGTPLTVAGVSCFDFDSLRRWARLQVAGFAGAVWQLAHDSHAHESMVEERGVGSRV